jgi:ATP-dependent Clp protease ATP-binding subunit ClpX
VKTVTLKKGCSFNLYTPKELKEHLDKFIIGQEEAKKTISVAVYNHYKRIVLNDSGMDIPIQKSNIMLAGPTGSGKTLMLKTIAKYMGVPCYIADATTLTQAGYVGDDVESILCGLVRAARWNIRNAECGMIVIDEVDKIAKRGSNVHISRDVVGEGVQQALLKMVEGDKVGIPPAEGRKRPDQQLIYIDTTNILFVGSGAFVGIDDIIKERMNIKQIGFLSDKKMQENAKFDDDTIYEYMSHEDLRAFGMIPEFIGRFPVITNVNKLSKDEMLKIITEPDDSILKQHQLLYSYDGYVLDINDDALDYIADVAMSVGTGARALRSIFERIFNETTFNIEPIDLIPDANGNPTNWGTITISKEDVEKAIEQRYPIKKEVA